MAAAHVSNSLSLNGSMNGSGIPGNGPMSKTRGILLETMQLVEPTKPLPVPNHLLESSNVSFYVFVFPKNEPHYSRDVTNTTMTFTVDYS